MPPAQLHHALPPPQSWQAKELLLRLRRRQLYMFCDEATVPPHMSPIFKKPTAADIVSHHTNDGLVSWSSLS